MTNRTSEQGSVKGTGAVLVVCVVAGLAYLGIGLATGQATFGVVGLLIMLAYGGVLLLGRRRSEAIALLAGDIADERQHDITRRALAFTANVLVVVLLGGFLASLAIESELAMVFAGLCAVGAVAFLSGILWHSLRG